MVHIAWICGTSFAFPLSPPNKINWQFYDKGKVIIDLYKMLMLPAYTDARQHKTL